MHRVAKLRAQLLFLRYLLWTPTVMLGVADLYGPGSGFGSSPATGTVFLQPGTNVIVNAIVTSRYQGVTIQLAAGTYNEDFSKLAGKTINGVWINGTGNPGGTRGSTAASMTAGESVINLTNATSGGTGGLWTNYGFERVVFTSTSGVSSAMGMLDNAGNQYGDFVRCLFFDMQCDVVSTIGHGASLYMEANTYVTSSTAPGAVGQTIGLPLGPYWSINEVFDFVKTNTAPRYIGTSGAQPVGGVSYGPYFVWGPTFGDQTMAGQDVAMDLEFGASSGLGYCEVVAPLIYNMKLAYLTNVGEFHADRPRLRVTPEYSVSTGCTLVIAGGTTGNSYVGLCEILNPTIIMDTTSSVLSNQLQQVVAFGTGASGRTNYIGTFRWRGGKIQVNPAFPVAGAGAGLFTFNFAVSDPFTQGFDFIDITDLEIGYNRSAVDSSAAAPTGIPILTILSATTPLTGGKVRLGIKVVGTQGTSPTAVTPGASPFTYTHGTSGATPATQGGVVSVTGGTVSSIAINLDNGGNVGTGLTSGSWFLKPGDKLVVTYTVAPTMQYYAGDTFQPITAGDGTHALFTFGATFGKAANTLTIADEEILEMDFTALAANAFTNFRNTLGTYTATRRKVGKLGPAEASQAITVGASPFTYQHGVTAALPAGAIAQGPGVVSLSAGTVSAVTLNGQTMDVSSAHNYYLEIGDTLIVTWSSQPTMKFAGTRRLGS